MRKSDTQLAHELLDLIQDRKKLEKREDNLKQYFKTRLSSQGKDTASIGGILISLVTRTRTDLDKKALAAQCGIEFLKSFEVKTEYTQVDVKEISVNLKVA